jgi:hypothetical protein
MRKLVRNHANGQTMITKLKRQECVEKYPKFPLSMYDPVKEEIDYTYPEVYCSYILTLQAKSFKSHVNLIANQVTNVVKSFNFDSLIFLGDAQIAWRYQSNEFKPVKEALQFLIDNNVGKRFNGAIKVPIGILPTFVKHLSWLTRCNASLPSFYFTDIQQNLIGSICKYGNLHIDTLHNHIDNLFRDIIEKSNFQFLTGRSCYESYSKTGAIRHRQIIL